MQRDKLVFHCSGSFLSAAAGSPLAHAALRAQPAA
jgi:hypothetical protein